MQATWTISSQSGAVELWQGEFGDRFAAPDTILARGENGDLVIVNVFPDDEAHTNFGRNLGGPLETVALSGPELEHLEVLKIAFETARASSLE